MRYVDSDQETPFRMVMRFTRNWLHYGWLVLITLCCLIAAVQGLMGR